MVRFFFDQKKLKHRTCDICVSFNDEYWMSSQKQNHRKRKRNGPHSRIGTRLFRVTGARYVSVCDVIVCGGKTIFMLGTH